jgi:hypothetical protein
VVCFVSFVQWFCAAVVDSQISGLGLDGTMGYMLSNLMSLRTL